MFSCFPLLAQPAEAPSYCAGIHLHAMEVLCALSSVAAPVRSQILHTQKPTTTIRAFPFPSDASVTRWWIHSSSHDPP